MFLIASTVLSKNSFKKKGNKFIRELDDHYQVIYFDRSSFSNLYYIGMGFIIKELDLGGVRDHISTGVPNKSSRMRKNIKRTFDLESKMRDKKRNKEIEKFLINEVLPVLDIHKSIQDLEKLSKSMNPNFLPVVTKRFFGLDVE